MTHLLDTSTCVAIMRGRSASALRRYIEIGPDAGISSVVWFELQTGALKANRPEEERLKIENFAKPLKSLPFDDEAGAIAARTPVDLERRGLKIGAYDLQIAAIALQHDLTLVTSNTAEFSRIPNLRLEDWQTSD